MIYHIINEGTWEPQPLKTGPYVVFYYRVGVAKFLKPSILEPPYSTHKCLGSPTAIMLKLNPTSPCDFRVWGFRGFFGVGCFRASGFLGSRGF